MNNLLTLGTVAFAVSFLSITATASESNQAMKNCLDHYGYDKTAPLEERMKFDFSGHARCHSDYRVGKIKTELQEMRDFLEHNPRYRVPGQSQNRCWGKPREMPFESAYIEQTADGFKAGVSYKDTLPAGCYENGPWDNRDAN